MVPGFKKIRLKFSKTGESKFISHLDLNRTMKSVLSRAGVEIEYTHGFNPHPKLTFSLPLSLFTESYCEFLEISVAEESDFEEIKEKLNKNLPYGIKITEIYEPKNAFSDIEWSEYKFTLITPKASKELAEQLNELFSHEVIIAKRTKKTASGVMDFDINPYIKRLSASYESGCIKMDAVLSVKGDTYINPEYIISAIKKYLGIEFTDARTDSYSIVRTSVFSADMKEFK